MTESSGPRNGPIPSYWNHETLPFQGCRILVWGALGFIGFHLTEALIAAGFQVSVLCRSRGTYPEPRWGSRVRWHELDWANLDKAFDEAVASRLVRDAVQRFGAQDSYIFSIFNAVAFSGNHLEELKLLATNEMNADGS